MMAYITHGDARCWKLPGEDGGTSSSAFSNNITQNSGAAISSVSWRTVCSRRAYALRVLERQAPPLRCRQRG
jgi:hypothetical protein